MRSKEEEEEEEEEELCQFSKCDCFVVEQERERKRLKNEVFPSSSSGGLNSISLFLERGLHLTVGWGGGQREGGVERESGVQYLSFFPNLLFLPASSTSTIGFALNHSIASLSLFS